ncbi:MAG: aldo/keto reductase [Solirubrobacterales bacterium]
MVAKTFKLDEVELPRIGLGTNRLRDTISNRSFLRSAVAAGLGLIDTARLYAGGDSEAAIGAALAPYPGSVAVATKGGYRSNEPDGIRAEIEQSLVRLRTDTIDLWYLHRFHDDAPLESTMRLIGEYVDAGRIRRVGLSEVTVAQIRAARAIVPIAAVQNEYGLGERKHEDVIDFCAAEGIAFVPFYPLAGGEGPALLEAAERRGASPDQIKLAWLLHRSECIVPIPGTLSIEHFRANLAALEIELRADELRSLAGAA